MLHTRAIATKATRILHAVYYFPVSLTIFKTTKINGVCEFPTSEDNEVPNGGPPVLPHENQKVSTAIQYNLYLVKQYYINLVV
jgi:hypothetical protein